MWSKSRIWLKFIKIVKWEKRFFKQFEYKNNFYEIDVIVVLMNETMFKIWNHSNFQSYRGPIIYFKLFLFINGSLY